MKILVDSCIRGLDRIRVSKSGKLSSARPQEGGRHAVSKLRRAVSMKIAIKDRQRSNSAARFKAKKTVSERRRANKAKSFRLHSSNNAVWMEPPQMCDSYREGQGPCI